MCWSVWTVLAAMWRPLCDVTQGGTSLVSARHATLCGMLGSCCQGLGFRFFFRRCCHTSEAKGAGGCVGRKGGGGVKRGVVRVLCGCWCCAHMR